jgi:hypothetical protein
MSSENLKKVSKELLFLQKKAPRPGKQKNSQLPWRLRGHSLAAQQPAGNKSFLLLFFKKEVLP